MSNIIDGKRRFILRRSTGEGYGINVEAEQVRADCRLIAEAGTVHHETGLTPRQLAERVKELEGALIRAQEAINSMKVEAETAAQGDEQMMLEAFETISNEGWMRIWKSGTPSPKLSPTRQRRRRGNEAPA